MLPLKNNSFKILFSLFLLFGFIACQKEYVDPFDPVKQAADEDALIREYMARDTTIKDFTKTASGLYYIKRKAGTDPQIQSGNTVKAHYIGRFLNGQKFDSSYDKNSPMLVTVDKTGVIKGWTEGLKLMQKGEKATLYIPSALGYGLGGSSNIPPNTVLVFDLEILSVTQ
jgi:FKBP-type peptidyl-prolyl cis-trans isomerase